MSFSRTAAGEAELVARALPLSIPTRRLLSMIEGIQTAESLAAKARFTELDRMLHELLERGLITSTGPHAKPEAKALATTPAVKSASPTAAVLTRDQIPAVKRLGARFIIDNLGPNGESLALRIERAADAVVLEQELHDVRRILFELRGRAISEKFYETVIAPSFGAST
jgi:hypothetical protein